MAIYAGSFRELGQISKPWWSIVLSVRPDASKREIVSAYRKHALVNHPDRGGHEELMKTINEAKAAAFKDRGFA